MLSIVILTMHWTDAMSVTRFHLFLVKRWLSHRHDFGDDISLVESSIEIYVDIFLLEFSGGKIDSTRWRLSIIWIPILASRDPVDEITTAVLPHELNKAISLYVILSSSPSICHAIISPAISSPFLLRVAGLSIYI